MSPIHMQLFYSQFGVEGMAAKKYSLTVFYIEKQSMVPKLLGIVHEYWIVFNQKEIYCLNDL